MIVRVPTGEAMQRAVIDQRDRSHDDRASLVDGLRATPAAIPPKYFYDPLGCALYGAICATPEYYPTRTEAAIFAAHAEAIASGIRRGATLVDLGAGDGAKAQWWIPRLVASRYVGVDYAAEALQGTLDRLAAAFPGLELQGVAADFAAGLDVSAVLPPGAATFFYPGSSIGNFAPDDALALLKAVRAHATPRREVGLLIGVDTHKDEAKLVAAYDDALGVTAAFNRNVLNHVNAILGTRFDPSAFRHVALYDGARRRIEMHLEAMRDVLVDIDGVARPFRAGERIHTENSYKYAPEAFEALLRDAGFGTVRCWTDANGDFAVFHAV
jgi:L-histidine N-alpha-methyltransferase